MKIEVEGYNLNELIKVLYRKKIALKNIAKQSSTKLTFEIDDSQHAKVKRYILNYKVKTGLSKLKQLPKFFLANLGIVLGLFFGGLFAIFASCFTWQINVYGTEQLSPNEIIAVLAENGIKKGKINNVTSEEIETILLNNYNRIAQVSAIKQGTSIIINLSEKLVYDDSTYSPIVANYSGIITEVHISTGTTNVKVGDYVNAGDVLVLPFNLDANGNKISVKPLAEIKAKMFVVGSSSISRVEKVFKQTGKFITTYKYSLFNFNIYSGKNKNSFAIYETKVYNETVSDLIPFKRQKVVFYELSSTEITHNFEKEKEDLEQKSYANAQKLLPINYKLIEEKTISTIVEDVMYATTTFTINGIINN